MYILSSSDINFFCVLTVQNAVKRKNVCQFIFAQMLVSGLRYNDLFKCFNSSISGNDFIINPSKGNNPRVLFSNEITTNFKPFCLGSPDPFFTIPYTSVLKSFYSCSPVRSVNYANKKIGLHIFRHNYFRILQSSGLSIPELALRTGEKNQSSVLSYISSELSVNSKSLLYP